MAYQPTPRVHFDRAAGEIEDEQQMLVKGGGEESRGIVPLLFPHPIEWSEHKDMIYPCNHPQATFVDYVLQNHMDGWDRIKGMVTGAFGSFVLPNSESNGQALAKYAIDDAIYAGDKWRMITYFFTIFCAEIELRNFYTGVGVIESEDEVHRVPRMNEGQMRVFVKSLKGIVNDLSLGIFSHRSFCSHLVFAHHLSRSGEEYSTGHTPRECPDAPPVFPSYYPSTPVEQFPIKQ